MSLPPPPSLTPRASKMEKEQGHMTERILNLTLEIIYLLTGKDYAVVKTSGEPSAPGVLSSDLRRKRKINEKKILKATSQIIDLLAEEDWENGEGGKDPSKMAECGTQTPSDWSSVRSSAERGLPQEDAATLHHDQVGISGGIKIEYVTAEEDEGAEPAFIAQDGQYSETSIEAPTVSQSKMEDKSSEQRFAVDVTIDPDLHPVLQGTETSPRPSKADWLLESVALRKQTLGGSSKLFPCTECSRCFTSMCNRDRHMKIHKGEKPFSCTHCGKCFARKSHVAMHERSHTGEKPYCCSMCGKCFKHKSHLVTHTRTHTGEKPFICVECGKCFTQKANLLYHQKAYSCGKK